MAWEDYQEEAIINRVRLSGDGDKEETIQTEAVHSRALKERSVQEGAKKR
jgi:hypothetical protein